MSSSTSTPLSFTPLSSAPLSSTRLQLFPSPSASRPPPRKSSMEKPRSGTSGVSGCDRGAIGRGDSVPPAQAELVGIAMKIDTRSKNATRIQPADNQIKHITITPRSSTIQLDAKASNTGSPKRQLRTRRRSSAHSLEPEPCPSEPLLEEDQLSPLPVNTSFLPSSPPRIRTPTGRKQRDAPPKPILINAEDSSQQMPADDDQLSPLPSKDFFRPPTPPTVTEYPSPSSFRSGGSTLVRSNSDAVKQFPATDMPAPQMRSMFPQYDHSKPLSHQQYHPTQIATPPSMTRMQISKRSSKPCLKREDSAIALLDEYQTLPSAREADLLAIWHASTTTSPPTGRKVQLELQQPSGHGMSLTVGMAGTHLYKMEINGQDSSPRKDSGRQLAISKLCPTAQIAAPVAQVPIDRAQPSQTGSALAIISPQQAAVDAIHFVANSPAACEIAYFDPVGKSPEAARLAQDAVAEARRRYTCELTRSTRRRDSFGAVSASYRLQHPSLGPLTITVSKATSSSAPNDPKAKITLHHPSATEAAVAAENLALLSLDFATNACVLDTPALLALDEPYLLDTAISAVFTVAVIENEQVVQDTMTFAPPPKMPVATSATKKRTSRSASPITARSSGKKAKRDKWYRSLGRKEKVKEIKQADDDLPALAHGALTIVGLGLRGAVWLVGAGFKIGAGAVRMAAK